MANYSPTDVANEALDAILWPDSLGDIQSGDHEAQVMLRAYGLCRKQLLRAANWSFARKTAPMLLLADATGNTPNVGTIVPNPWYIYEYALPNDCLRPRFIPWNLSNQADVVPPNNIQIPSTPLTGGIGQQGPIGQRIRPAQFTVEMDYNYPPPPGQLYDQVEGVSPQARTVICTNVRYASLVYTADMLYPSNWDPLFRSAMVAYMASKTAGSIWSKKDPKFGMQVQAQQENKLRAVVEQARIADGNSAGPTGADIAVDWMTSRRVGGSWGAGNGGGQGWWGGGGGGSDSGWDTLPLASGSYF